MFMTEGHRSRLSAAPEVSEVNHETGTVAKPFIFNSMLLRFCLPQSGQAYEPPMLIVVICPLRAPALKYDFTVTI